MPFLFPVHLEHPIHAGYPLCDTRSRNLILMRSLGAYDICSDCLAITMAPTPRTVADDLKDMFPEYQPAKMRPKARFQAPSIDTSTVTATTTILPNASYDTTDNSLQGSH